MSYQKFPYTFGAKTMAEMQLLPAKPGDTVFNLDWQIVETCVYEQNLAGASEKNPGPVWTNDQSYLCICDGPIQKGNVMAFSSLNTASLAAGDIYAEYCGVVIRGEATEVGDKTWGQLAYMGKYEVLYTDEVSRGQFGGLGVAEGQAVPVTLGYVGSDKIMCKTLEPATNGAGNSVLAMSIIQTIEYQ
tara:strand:+ start:3139 stop:3702 length:564 start_codon:yes stop_codon:yes gene_type:complete